MGGIIPKELKLKHPEIFSVNLNLKEDSEYGKMLAEKFGKKKEEPAAIVVEESGDVSVVSVTETEKVEESKEITAPFTMPDYVFDFDGTVRPRNSSIEDEKRDSIPTSGLADIIINNPIIKEIIPDLKSEDIFVANHMLLMKVKRNDGEEIYRLDIINDNILVQAPMETYYTHRKSGTKYKYVSVPISTELGKKILSTENYQIKSSDSISANDSIFREDQNAA